MFKFRFQWTTIIFHYFEQLPTLFGKIFFFEKFCLIWSPLSIRKKYEKKWIFSESFQNFITLFWHTWDVTVQISRATNHFEGSYSNFSKNVKKSGFQRIFKNLIWYWQELENSSFYVHTSWEKVCRLEMASNLEFRKIFPNFFTQKNENFYFWVVAVLSKIFVLRGSRLVFWQIFRKFPELI